MKITTRLVILATVLSVCQLRADYSIQLLTANNVPNPPAATNPVLDVDGSTRVDSTFFGQVTVNGTFIGAPVNFGKNGNTVVSQLDGFLSAGTLNITHNSLIGGSVASVQLFAWKGASDYATAAVTPGAKIGSSTPVNVTLGGFDINNDPVTVPRLTSISGFTLSTVAVPEPATIALGMFGAAGLLIRRRK